MADLSVKFAGLTSPNPFWLASGPPTNTGGQVMRAFDAGWGEPSGKRSASPSSTPARATAPSISTA